ncbi:hypothetical protein [Aquimarina agarilytica]|uniref:hypothetical protein n=1 Tax=Aquimarina agarilytica TaxID=1087449 RepID=UPI0012FA8B88|nr:hypothetical protein [Aquimarina agarilytica]
MIRIALFICITFFTNIITAQIFDKKPKCSKEIFLLSDLDTISNKTKEYKALKCVSRKNLGVRLGIGVSGYQYDDKTKSVIGNHGGPNFNLSIAYDKLNIGARFKPWTFNPKQELEVENKTLPETAKVNIIKLDYYAGYSIDLKKLYSIEPYLGYNSSLLKVINEDELGETFAFEKRAGGFLFGSTFNKYFEFQDFSYIAAFIDIGYATTDLSKIHPELGKGYFEFSVGIAVKGFAKKQNYKKIN